MQPTARGYERSPVMAVRVRKYPLAACALTVVPDVCDGALQASRQRG